MRLAGFPWIVMSLMIVCITALASTMRVVRLHPEEHIYQVQLLGNIMILCPESFGREASTVDCERWLRQTRGGSTVFVQPISEMGFEEDTPKSNRDIRFTTAIQVTDVDRVVYTIRPKPRPTQD